MKRPRHQRLIPDARAFRVASDNSVHQRAGLLARKWLDRHSRGLVIGQQRIVLEDAARTHRGVRQDPVVPLLGQRDNADGFASTQLEPLDRGAAIHQHLPAGAGLAAERAG